MERESIITLSSRKRTQQYNDKKMENFICHADRNFDVPLLSAYGDALDGPLAIQQ